MGRTTTAPQGARRASRQLARRRQGSHRSLVALTALVVLLLAVLTGVGVWQANRSEDAAVPAAAGADPTGLPAGTGAVTVEIYLDFLCPACREFDRTARPVLDRYLDEGTITVVYHPIAILDQQTSTRFSTRAAAAAGCAADAGAVDGFVAAMMAVQPPEGGAGLSDDQISQIGAQAGAGEGFGQCVSDGTYRAWAGQSTDAAFERGVRGTPTVFIQGELLEPRTVEAMIEAIESAAAEQ